MSFEWRGQYISLLGLFVLLGFTWLPNSYLRMVSWPYVVIWQAAFLILDLCSIWLCRQFSVSFRPLGHGLDWAMCLVVITSVFSSLNSDFSIVSFWNLSLLFQYGVALYLVVNLLREGPLTRHHLWVILSTSGVITSIISLVLWRPSLDMWFYSDFDSAIRNPFPLGHHNFVGGYELIMLPIVASFAFTQKGWKKWCALLATILVSVALYASGSRGALLGAISMGLFSVTFGVHALNHGKLRRRWLMSGLCLLLIVGLAFASNPRTRTLFASTVSAAARKELSIDALNDGPLKDRLLMLKTTQNVFRKNPLLGVGPGNLSRVYNLYRPIEAGSGLELVQQVHNTPAQIVTELGFAGAISFAFLIGCLLRLCFSLFFAVVEQSERLLLYGISASGIGYGVSSLTDYQLENIGISMSLTVLICLLVSTAETSNPSSVPKDFLCRTRRIISLLLLTFVCIVSQLWARVDVGLYLTHLAQYDSQSHNFVDADAKWYKASQLVPWDPTYAILASEQLIELVDNTADSDVKDELTKDTILHLENAYEAAPHDSWVNQNLAVLSLRNNYDVAKAETYISRTALLYPRNDNYTYYTLGLVHLQKSELEKATAAFVLEGLAHPKFLMASVWDKQPLASMHSEVVNSVLASYEKILSKTDVTLHQYDWLETQFCTLKWYFNFLPYEREFGSDSLMQVLMKIDGDPSKALESLNQKIAQEGKQKEWLLLRAWLSPDEYLDEFFLDAEGSLEERIKIEENIRTHRNIRDWLISVSSPPTQRYRQSVGFAYRNASANAIKRILYPDELQVNFLVDFLGLLPDAPREFSQLDYEMDFIRTEYLDLILPFDNNLQLPAD